VIDGFELFWIPQCPSFVSKMKANSNIFCEKAQASHLGEAEGW